MKIPELMAALSARYPNQLGKQAQIDAWAEDYRRALPEGLKLAEAWGACRAKWTKATFPRPADIAQYLPRDESKQNGEQEKPNRSVELFTWRHRMHDRYSADALRNGWFRGLNFWLGKSANYFREVIPETEIQAMMEDDARFEVLLDKAAEERAQRRQDKRKLGTAAKRVLADLATGEAVEKTG